MKQFDKMSNLMYYIIFALHAVLLFLLYYIVLLKKKYMYFNEVERGQMEKKESAAVVNQFLILWLEHKIKGDEIVSSFEEYGFQKVAIYGMGKVGMLLYNELLRTDIDVAYGIDKNKIRNDLDLEILKPEEFEGNVDAVIVTPIYYFSEIYDVLNEKLKNKIPILGLDEILYRLGEVKC